MGFTRVQGQHTFPVDETLIHQWTRTQRGWTGIFVFVASFVIGMLTGGFGGWAFGQGLTALSGGAVGGFGGLITSGFNPSTNVTVEFTPFHYSVHQLNPSLGMTGHQRTIADRTRANWIMPDPQNTPGGVSRYVLSVDFRKILHAGSQTTMHTMPDDRSSAVVVIPGDDPRFNTVFDEMWKKPHVDLQRHVYPFAPRDAVPVPVPIR